MKYNEDVYLQEAFEYICSTYGQHYAGEQEVQLFDYWQSLGILTPVAIGTAMKYLARFGKKDGKNKKDLLKAIHYTILAMYSEFGAVVQEGDPGTPPDGSTIVAEASSDKDTKEQMDRLLGFIQQAMAQHDSQ